MTNTGSHSDSSEDNLEDNPYFAAFNKHYDSLSTALPADAMYPTFISEGLLRNTLLTQQFRAAKTDTEKTRLLLDSMMEGVRIGKPNLFLTLLKAMTNYASKNNDPVVEKLVKDVYKDLPSAGTYVINYNLCVIINTTFNHTILYKLRIWLTCMDLDV